MFALEVSLLLAACASLARDEPTLEPALTPVGGTLVPTLPRETEIHADIILTESQNQIPTTVKVGQIIQLQISANAKWTLNFRPEVLSLLTPHEQASQPGLAGWFFRAIAPGSTEIALESIPPLCLDGTVCPPNLMRFVFPIQVAP